MNGSRLLRALAIAVVALAGVATTSCGIGFDDEPRALEQEASTTTVVATPSVGQLSTILYYVRDGSLLPVEEELPDRTVSTLVAALATAPSANGGNGLSSSIPAGTTVLSSGRADDRLRIDLSSEFDKVVGLSRQQAIGQIVLTVTEQGPVEEVEFQVEGETLTVSSPRRGDTTVVNECDFAALLASPDDLVGADLPAQSVEDLAERRAELAAACPIDNG
jgi:hypothetical protein